jgi:hypothetical protein
MDKEGKTRIIAISILCNRKSAKEIVEFHKTKRAQFTTSKRNRMCTLLMAPLMILRKAEKFT